MLTKKRSDEMIFQWSSSESPHLQHTAIPPNPMLPFTQIDGKRLYNNQPKGRQPKPPAFGEDPDDDDVQKKLMHRDIERRRRQEMATLYASLRSLLPLEYIMGKRSISDHMNEAVKYIKHLQIRIKELGAKRDNLRKLYNWNVVDQEIRSSSSSTAEQPTNKVTVRVNKCLGGLEVVLNCSLMVQMLPLSRLLDMLLKDGLNVVDCVYTNVEQRQIYTLNLEVSDLTGIEPSSLERKIEEAISSLSNSSLLDTFLFKTSSIVKVGIQYI